MCAVRIQMKFEGALLPRPNTLYRCCIPPEKVSWLGRMSHWVVLNTIRQIRIQFTPIFCRSRKRPAFQAGIDCRRHLCSATRSTSVGCGGGNLHTICCCICILGQYKMRWLADKRDSALCFTKKFVINSPTLTGW